MPIMAGLSPVGDRATSIGALPSKPAGPRLPLYARHLALTAAMTLPVDNLVENSVPPLFSGDAQTGAARTEVFDKTIILNSYNNLRTLTEL